MCGDDNKRRRRREEEKNIIMEEESSHFSGYWRGPSGGARRRLRIFHGVRGISPGIIHKRVEN